MCNRTAHSLNACKDPTRISQLTPHFTYTTRTIHRIKVNLGKQHTREELSHKNTHTLETRQQAMEMLRQQNSKMLGAELERCRTAEGQLSMEDHREQMVAIL